LGIALVLGVLAGCSSDDSGTSSGAWTDAEAAQHYRDAVGPLSDQLAVLSQIAPDATIDDARAALRAYGAAAGAAARALADGRWAEPLQEPVEDLRAELQDQAAQFERLAGLPDVAAIQAESDASSASVATARSRAAAVERALGIDDGLLGSAAVPPSSVPATAAPATAAPSSSASSPTNRGPA
jgi:hypothetical protein